MLVRPRRRRAAPRCRGRTSPRRPDTARRTRKSGDTAAPSRSSPPRHPANALIGVRSRSNADTPGPERHLLIQRPASTGASAPDRFSAQLILLPGVPVFAGVADAAGNAWPGELISKVSMALAITASRHGRNGSRCPDDAGGRALCASATGGQAVWSEAFSANSFARRTKVVRHDFSSCTMTIGKQSSLCSLCNERNIRHPDSAFRGSNCIQDTLECICVADSNRKPLTLVFA